MPVGQRLPHILCGATGQPVEHLHHLVFPPGQCLVMHHWHVRIFAHEWLLGNGIPEYMGNNPHLKLAPTQAMRKFPYI